jgi:hypothetical protein
MVIGPITVETPTWVPSTNALNDRTGGSEVDANVTTTGMSGPGQVDPVTVARTSVRLGGLTTGDTVALVGTVASVAGAVELPVVSPAVLGTVASDDGSTTAGSSPPEHPPASRARPATPTAAATDIALTG